MIISNTRGKTYGQIAALSGYILSITGIITFTLSGLFVAAAGLFIGFSTRGTMFDTDGKRFKVFRKYFGLFSSGNWRPITEMECIRLITASSKDANHSLRIKSNNVHIILQGKFKHEQVFIKQCTTMQAALGEAQQLGDLLGLRVELGGTRA